MKGLLSIIFFTLVFSLLILPNITQAQLPSLVPPECRGPQFSNECNLSSVEETAIRAAQIVIGVTGSATLLMFVLGGVRYMISGGNAEKIKKANSMLVNSAIGLAIIMFAGLAIRLLLATLTGSNAE